MGTPPSSEKRIVLDIFSGLIRAGTPTSSETLTG